MFRCSSNGNNINNKKDHVNSLKRYKRVEQIGKETSKFKVDLENSVGGKSQLKIELPPTFPEEPPTMTVPPDNFNHPLVDSQTGEVKYEKLGMNWAQEPMLLVNIVKKVVDELEKSSMVLQRDLRKESQQSGLLSMSRDDLKDQENTKRAKILPTPSPKDRLRWRLSDGKATDVVLVVEKSPFVNGKQEPNKLIAQNASGEYVVLTNSVDAAHVHVSKRTQADFEMLINCCVQLLTSQALIQNQLVAHSRNATPGEETNVEYSTINSLSVKNNVILASLNNGNCVEPNKLTIISSNLANLIDSITRNTAKQISDMKDQLNKCEKDSQEWQQKFQETKQVLEETLTKLNSCQNELAQSKQDVTDHHHECCQLIANNSQFQNEKDMMANELEKIKADSTKLQEELQSLRLKLKANEGENSNSETLSLITVQELDTREDELKGINLPNELVTNTPVIAVDAIDEETENPKTVDNSGQWGFFKNVNNPLQCDKMLLHKYKQLLLARFVHCVPFSILMLSCEFVQDYWNEELHELQTKLGEMTIPSDTPQVGEDKEIDEVSESNIVSTQDDPLPNKHLTNLWSWLLSKMSSTPYPLRFITSPLLIQNITPRTIKMSDDHFQHEQKHAHIIVSWQSMLICEPRVLLNLPIHVCCSNLVPVCLVNIVMDDDEISPR